MVNQDKDTRAWTQRHFSWIPEDFQHDCWRKPARSRRRPRTRIRSLKWPPRKGQKIAFRGDFGVEIGILREIRQGLVWTDYILKDGRIIAEGALVMCPERTAWRHPASVPEGEWKDCVARIKAAHDADPEKDLKQLPEVWSDICQFMAYTAFKNAIENERKKLALMEVKATIPPC